MMKELKKNTYYDRFDLLDWIEANRSAEDKNSVDRALKQMCRDSCRTNSTLLTLCFEECLDYDLESGKLSEDLIGFLMKELGSEIKVYYWW